MALTQELDLVGTVHIAHVRDGIEETTNVGQHTVLDGVGPELARYLELLIDRDGLGDVNRPVGLLRGVVQLAQCRVAGSCVVPGVAAFTGGRVQALDQGDRQVRFDQPQQSAKRRTHDPRPNQGNVCLLHLRF
ncbi:Uncharacterised protein [Mycobacteroides abscessus subsp. abscessus]|nr:Uncharacterised protein [Mycobacteroides abscessus subsp. abscessus]